MTEGETYLTKAQAWAMWDAKVRTKAQVKAIRTRQIEDAAEAEFDSGYEASEYADMLSEGVKPWPKTSRGLFAEDFDALELMHKGKPVGHVNAAEWTEHIQLLLD